MTYSFRSLKLSTGLLLVLFLFLFREGSTMAQEYRFTGSFNPFIAWFGSDVDSIKNEGARAGFDITVKAEKALTDNILLTGGISFINSGGRISKTHAEYFRLPDYETYIKANNSVIYKIQYLSLPVGIKFKTNEKGDYSFYAELGFDPKVMIRGRVDIPSNNLSNQKATRELHRLNLGYHINGGVNYYLNESFTLNLGAGFENNFIDVTKDFGSQGKDKITQKFFRFIFGITYYTSL